MVPCLKVFLYIPNVSFVVFMDNFSAFILKLVVIFLFSTLLIFNIECQKTLFFYFLNVCPYLVFKILFVTGVKAVTCKFRNQGISLKQCQQVSVSLRTITYWNIQIIKYIQYLRNTQRNFFFFLILESLNIIFTLFYFITFISFRKQFL